MRATFFSLFYQGCCLHVAYPRENDTFIKSSFWGRKRLFLSGLDGLENFGDVHEASAGHRLQSRLAISGRDHRDPMKPKLGEMKLAVEWTQCELTRFLLNPHHETCSFTSTNMDGLEERMTLFKFRLFCEKYFQ